jgi:type IV secretory pathway VirB3-like protein
VLARLFARLPPLWAVVALFVGLTLPQALLGLPVAAAAVGSLRPAS